MAPKIVNAERGRKENYPGKGLSASTSSMWAGVHGRLTPFVAEQATTVPDLLPHKTIDYGS